MVIESAYRIPPIVEAVIDFQFAAAMKPRDLERLKDKFVGRYPSYQERREVQFQVDGAVVTTQQRQDGYLMRTADGANCLILQPKSVTASQLAPYGGWSALLKEAMLLLEAHQGIVGRLPFSRLSTRYINRIDLPEAEGTSDLSQVFSLKVVFPFQGADAIIENSINFLLRDSAFGFKYRINVANAPPALLDHRSFLLDIDVYEDEKLPMKDDDVIATLHRMRDLKNRVFEGSITDALRGAFK